MSDLRASPGETLDAVATGGEHFIVERKGRFLACIVPVDLFMPNIPPKVIHAEMSRLDKIGERYRMAFTQNEGGAHQLEFLFDVAVPGAACETLVPAVLRIVLLSNFPTVPASAYFVRAANDGQKSALRDDTPYVDQHGAIELLPVLEEIPDNFSVLFTLEAAQRWLKYYNTWASSGTWPDEEPTDET